MGFPFPFPLITAARVASIDVVHLTPRHCPAIVASMRLYIFIYDILCELPHYGIFEEFLAMRIKTRFGFVQDAKLTTTLRAAFFALLEAASEVGKCGPFNTKQLFHSFKICGWGLLENDTVRPRIAYFCGGGFKLLLGDNLFWVDFSFWGLSVWPILVFYKYMSSITWY